MATNQEVAGSSPAGRTKSTTFSDAFLPDPFVHHSFATVFPQSKGFGALNALCRWLHEQGILRERVRLQPLNVRKTAYDAVVSAEASGSLKMLYQRPIT